MDFSKLASEESIENTKNALEKNGIQVFVAENGTEAKEKVLQMLPAGAEVMNMTSVTLESIGVANEILNSGKFNSAREKFKTIDKLSAQKLGAAPEWVVGSVHAVTELGQVLIASASGSQLPAYSFGSSHVIWVLGSQKIVKDFDQAMQRIYDYVLPLENERALKAYGQGSAVNKLLILNKEVVPGRITMIIVKEKLGF